MFGKISVKIKGLTPLLMHKINPDDLIRKTKIRDREYNPDEQARKAAYMDNIGGKEQLYIPAEAVYGCIIKTSKRYTSGKLSLRSILAGAIRIEPNKISLGCRNYKVDTRPVVVQNQRVMRSRPRIDDWEVNFNIVYFKNVIKGGLISTLKTILEDGGLRVGLLDFRPDTSGPFGTFKVVEFKEAK